MRIEDGKLILEKKDCTLCEEGTICTKENCPKCGGTGRGPRGGKGKCKPCFGSGNYYNHDKRSVCPICGGNYKGFEMEVPSDYAPKELWQSLNFKVYRQNRGMTWNEQHIGIGSIYCCVDYGRAWKEEDSKVIQDVQFKDGKQAGSSFTDRDGVLCDHIGIFLTPEGYSVKPLFVQDGKLVTKRS